ncbi:hypothetical protein B296_00048286 [Ensete ventricosum]|uniref:Uncharacterized protein n=1 Tax=Ensete ventricosum TaxID=4639 RepID=A0A426YD35_ENSVE|nr:hypothetical protein B296_00048286 [Ensete ventricosum]
MAAIKRSQANQRRNPDTFHLYQQQQQSAAAAGGASSFSGVKVELQQLVLAILDDPVVSRVFGDAGFRSTDIKLAILRPPPPILRFPRAARCPPLFLCNFSAGDGFETALSPRGLVFPFATAAGQLRSDGSDENCRRIAEILARKSSGRNPMLVGVGAGEAARDFAQAVERQNWAVLPPELRGIKLVSIEKEVAELGTGGGDQLAVCTRLEELGNKAESPGAILNVGDLKGMVEGSSDCDEKESCLVSELSRLLEVYQARLWVMGWSATYETYMKFLSKHPMLDKDWDLQLLPITSVRTGMGGSLPRPPRWAKDDKTVFNANAMDLQKKWNDNSQCLHHGCQTTDTEDRPAVPGDIEPSCISNTERACTHNSENLDDAQNQRGFGMLFPISEGTKKITAASKSISLPSLLEPGNKDFLLKLQVRPSKSEQLQRESFQSCQGDDHASPSSVTSVMTDLVLGTLHEPLCNKGNPALQVQKDNSEDLPACLPSMNVNMVKRNGPHVPVDSFSCIGHQGSPTNGTPQRVLTRSFSQVSNGCASAYDKPSFISSSILQKFDLSNYKSFCSSLINKVGRQEEAISAISQAIVRCKSGERRRGACLRGDIWLSFCGPDKIGKKRVAVALAELIYGSKEDFVCIDLSYQDRVAHPSTICAQQEVNGNDVQFRGKMNVDHIAAELSQKLQSVIFLENVDKADFLVQNSLSQAIRTGKFPDSHGREFGINNAIFILTSARIQGQTFSQRKECSSFSEETILAASCWQMKIFLEPSRESISRSPRATNVSLASSQISRNNQVYLQSVLVCKRKLDVSDDCKSQYESLMFAKKAHKTAKVFLDLNLPVEEVEVNDNNSSSHEDYSKSETSESWMKDFFDLVDASVDFKPFNFDALADNMLKDINKIFRGAAGPDCLLEVDQKVMEEILAAAWSLEDRGALTKWFEQVLGRSLMELRCQHNLSEHSILRLVAFEDAYAQEHAPGVLLPSRIIIS